MKLLITGGGTAGHITPLLAIAAEVKKRHPQTIIKYIGQHGDAMYQLVASDSSVNKSYKIFAGKWRRYSGVGFWKHTMDVKTVAKNFRDVIYLVLGFMQSMVLLVVWRPDVVFVKGGYVGLPVGLAAALLRIKIVIHDSDVVPGLTNRILARFAKAIAVGMPPEVYKQFYPATKTHFTGIPIRPEFFDKYTSKVANARRVLNIKPSDQLVLVIGGSLGAVRLNNAVSDCLSTLLNDNRRQLIWITGSHQYSRIEKQLKRLSLINSRVHIFSFVSDVQAYMAASDVIVSRAGATAIAELAALAKPVIFVPNPLLTNGHQTKNAALIQSLEAGIIVSECQLQKSREVLTDALNLLFKDVNCRQKISQNLNKLAVPTATAKIVDVIERVAK